MIATIIILVFIILFLLFLLWLFYDSNIRWWVSLKKHEREAFRKYLIESDIFKKSISVERPPTPKINEKSNRSWLSGIVPDLTLNQAFSLYLLAAVVVIIALAIGFVVIIVSP